MIAKEFSVRYAHYGLLLFVLCGLFSSFLFVQDRQMRYLLSILIGIAYTAWGIWTHRGEVATLRLMLEYVAIGILGSVILIILTKTI